MQSAAPTIDYIHYQNSNVGQAFTDAVDELVHADQIQPQLGNLLLQRYDSAVGEMFRQVTSKCTIKARLSSYRNCDDVWTFVLRNVQLRSDNEVVSTDHMKIVACKLL